MVTGLLHALPQQRFGDHGHRPDRDALCTATEALGLQLEHPSSGGRRLGNAPKLGKCGSQHHVGEALWGKSEVSSLRFILPVRAYMV